MMEGLKKPDVTPAALLQALRELGAKPAQPDKPTIRTSTMIRPQTFEGRRAGETRAFTKKRQKNRLRNKLAKASRKR